MVEYTKDELGTALQALASMIRRSENVQIKLKAGSSQASLVRNRLKALHIASALVTKVLEVGSNNEFKFDREDLEKSLPPITSTIIKCEKALVKLKDGTPQTKLTKNMIHALSLSLSLIHKELSQL